MVWAENANIAKRWSKPEGIPILTEWYDAVIKYNNAVIANQTVDAIGNLYIIPPCFQLIQPYITNYQCRKWFADTYIEYGTIVLGLGLGTVSNAQANDYMISVYPKFQKACGYPGAYNKIQTSVAPDTK